MTNLNFTGVSGTVDYIIEFDTVAFKESADIFRGSEGGSIYPQLNILTADILHHFDSTLAKSLLINEVFREFRSWFSFKFVFGNEKSVV